MKTVFNNPLSGKEINLDPCKICNKPGWFYHGPGALFCADCTNDLFLVLGEAISQPTPDLPNGVGAATAGAAASAGFSLPEIANHCDDSVVNTFPHPHLANDGERRKSDRDESERCENQNVHFNSSNLFPNI